MRIRKSASRFLGSTYSVPAAPAPDVARPFEPLRTPPPMPLQAPCSAPESVAGSSYASPPTASVETCELSRSPWDLIAELSISDPQVEDDLLDKYFVSVTCRASWLFTASMPVASVKRENKKAAGASNAGGTTQPRNEAPRKAPKKLAVSKEKESELMKKPKVKKEEEEQELEAEQTSYKCKKNDGRQWQCQRPVSRPNSLCDYHFYRRRAHLNPEFAAALAVAEAKLEMKNVPQRRPVASKPSTTSNPSTTSKPATGSKPATTSSKPATTSKPRKKKPGHDFVATEGFYYYAGFDPFGSKRQCRSSGGMNEPVPQQVEVDEPAHDNKKAAARKDESSSDNDIAGIAGRDEESSDDDYRLGVPGRSMNGNREHRDGMGNGWKKRWRKPVKARSLKSLM